MRRRKTGERPGMPRRVLSLETMPEGLRGTPPRWWSKDKPVLAYGPFAIEYSPARVAVGILLREDDQDKGCWRYNDGDRERVLSLTGPPAVTGSTISVPTTEGPVVVRQLRPTDEQWVVFYQIPDEENEGDLVRRIRRANNW